MIAESFVQSFIIAKWYGASHAVVRCSKITTIAHAITFFELVDRGDGGVDFECRLESFKYLGIWV